MEKGKVQTVLGTINPENLGLTHCHEHLHMTFEVAYSPASPEEKHCETLPIEMRNIGWIKQNPYSHLSNLRLDDTNDAVLEEIKLFKKKGGGSIVENSTVGLNRDIHFVKKVAEETGVNIIAGTGFYVDASLPASFGSRSLEDLAREMTHDLTVGVGDTGIKCGVIGEIGCSWPLRANEKKSLQATAHVQSQLGCPVIIHPGRNPDAPGEIVRILQEAGGDISKTIMSHLDRTLFTKETIVEFAKTGCYCEFDLFGLDLLSYQYEKSIIIPSDSQRIERVKYLIEDGYEDQVVIAHDIHTKHRLLKYGGHGYSHILENVVPAMLFRGVSQKTVDKMLIDNPRRWLTI